MKALWPARAILLRDLRIALSYRLNALLTLAATLFGVTLWYFLSRAVSPTTAGWDRGSYFGYLVVGTAFLGYVNMALHTFGQKLKQDQLTGTLEVFLGAPGRPVLLVAASLLWDLVAQTLQVAATLGIALLFGLELHVGSGPGLVLLLALSVVAFGALGLAASSLLLVFKRGEPITPFVGALFALLGGVFFPPAVLPPALAALSKLLPLPYALEGLRGLLLEGWTLGQVLPDLAALAFFCVILVPLALVAFPLCLRVARRYGLLSTY